MKNAKTNYASHTFHLLKAVASFSGVYNTELSSELRWDLTSRLLVKTEYQGKLIPGDLQYVSTNLSASGGLSDEIRQGNHLKPKTDYP